MRLRHELKLRGGGGKCKKKSGVDGCGALPFMRLLIKWTDGCGVQYVQREAALGTAALYGDIQVLAKESTDPAAAFGVLGNHVVFEPHCFNARRG